MVFLSVLNRWALSILLTDSAAEFSDSQRTVAAIKIVEALLQAKKKVREVSGIHQTNAMGGCSLCLNLDFD